MMALKRREGKKISRVTMTMMMKPLAAWIWEMCFNLIPELLPLTNTAIFITGKHYPVHFSNSSTFIMENQHQQQQQVVVEGWRIWAGDDKFFNVDGKTPKVRDFGLPSIYQTTSLSNSTNLSSSSLSLSSSFVISLLQEIIKLARKFHPSLGKDAELMINGASLYPKDWISFTKGLGGLVTFWDSGVGKSSGWNRGRQSVFGGGREKDGLS